MHVHVQKLGYYDPLRHEFVRTGWLVRFLKWEFTL
jgi:hypothetical protein